ncbi:MAG: cysteine dioxygenase family protein, partial [Planctomycetes bacterium]|nr:cysteine dioxygenase family protein [Planctomycetota bacterium]
QCRTALDGRNGAIFPPMTAMSTASSPTFGLQDYVRTIDAVLRRRPANPVIIREVSLATKQLCADDRWLEERHRVGSQDCYTRHLLHRDPENRFVVLALVWMPGQMTAIHDHSCWGVMGILQNSLEEVCYDRLDDGKRPDFAELEQSRGTDVGRGSVAYLLPPYEEIHRIGNTSNKPTISLHVYGRDLDAVNVFDQVTGKVTQMRIKYYSPECGKAPFVI